MYAYKVTIPRTYGSAQRVGFKSAEDSSRQGGRCVGLTLPPSNSESLKLLEP